MAHARRRAGDRHAGGLNEDASDRACDDFETQEEAQAVLEDVLFDPLYLDPSQDGIGIARGLLPPADDRESAGKARGERDRPRGERRVDRTRSWERSPA